MGWRDAIRTAGELGFDGVELVLKKEEDVDFLLTDSGRNEVLEWCDTFGCAVSSLSAAAFRPYSFPRRKRPMDDSIRFVSRCLEAAAGLNAAGVLFPHFDRQKIDIDADEEAIFIEGFTKCVPSAERTNVRVAVETTFSTSQLLRIIDNIDSPLVGVYFDVANAMIYGHDPQDMLIRLDRRVSMVHAKEKDGDLLGEGVVDWFAWSSAIAQVGYDGWVILETAPTAQPRDAAVHNLTFLREIFGLGLVVQAIQ